MRSQVNLTLSAAYCSSNKQSHSILPQPSIPFEPFLSPRAFQPLYLGNLCDTIPNSSARSFSKFASSLLLQKESMVLFKKRFPNIASEKRYLLPRPLVSKFLHFLGPRKNRISIKISRVVVGRALPNVHLVFRVEWIWDRSFQQIPRTENIRLMPTLKIGHARFDILGRHFFSPCQFFGDHNYFFNRPRRRISIIFLRLKTKFLELSYFFNRPREEE